MIRDATADEVRQLKQENSELKPSLAETILEVQRYRNVLAYRRRRYQGMSKTGKTNFIRLIEGSDLSISEPLAKYDVPRSTYYRWKRKLKTMGIKSLEDNKACHVRAWNQLLPQQVDKILKYATFYPEMSPREISLYVTDAEGFSVSESTVF